MFKQKSIWYGHLALLLVFIVLPAFVYSAPSEATRNNLTGITYECGDGNTAGNCDFYDLVMATRKVVNKGVQYALFFSVVVIAYAGFKYLVSGDNSGKRKEASTMLLRVVIGIVWVVIAWTVVNLITTVLLGRSLSQFFQ